MTDPVRPALDVALLQSSLDRPWTELRVVEETESTNVDLLSAPPGVVLAAEYQRSGRGRMDRSWTSPPRAGLLFSAVVAPPVAPSGRGWLPLLAGVAVCDAVAALTGLAVSLKWPNDVLLGELKLAGILVQASGSAAVIGVGLNVSTTRAELPVDTATSLLLAGAVDIDRSALLRVILAELGDQYLRWADTGGDAVASGLADAYRTRCATIGRAVTVVAQTGERAATAIGVEDDGRLRVRVADGEQVLAAGDIVHLRVRAV